MTYHSSSAQVWMAIVAAVSILMSGCSGNPLGGTLRWGPGHKDPCESPHCPTWTDCYGFHSTCWDRWPEECQTCPPPVDPSIINASHAYPTPVQPIPQPPIPLENDSPNVMDGDEESETEEMPNPQSPSSKTPSSKTPGSKTQPKVLEEPQEEEDEIVPPESDESPTTYLRPVKAPTSYYRSAKDRPREQPHVAYLVPKAELLPKPDTEPASRSVKATPVRASISDEEETVSLPRPVFPTTRLVR